MSKGWIGHWSPGIGDPTIMGWLTVLAYFLAAWLCWKARNQALVSNESDTRRSSLLWAAFALGLVFLGMNKQLDLQSAFTEIGRITAHNYGWYDERRYVQIFFIASVAIVGGTGFLLLLIAAKHELKRMLLVLSGIAGLGIFVLIRAASFHHFDEFISLNIAEIPMNWLLEIGSIALIVIGALVYIRLTRNITK